MLGHWQAGFVRGALVAKGWGAELGFPALVLADDGDPVSVQLFESSDLRHHWHWLDAFEGSEYRRVAVQVTTEAGALSAWIYVSAV